jgi:hypothetical protein
MGDHGSLLLTGCCIITSSSQVDLELLTSAIGYKQRFPSDSADFFCWLNFAYVPCVISSGTVLFI